MSTRGVFRKERIGKIYSAKLVAVEEGKDGTRVLRIISRDTAGNRFRWRAVIQDGEVIGNAVLDVDKHARREHSQRVRLLVNDAAKYDAQQLEMFPEEDSAAPSRLRALVGREPREDTAAE